MDGQAGAGPPAATPSPSREAQLKELAHRIPTTLDVVRVYPIGWEAYDPQCMEGPILTWVARKSKKLLGT